MAASDYFPDLPDIGDVLESEFRQRGWSYNKIENKGITKVTNVNFGKDDEPGSPTYGENVIFTEKEFVPLQHSTNHRDKYKKINMAKETKKEELNDEFSFPTEVTTPDTEMKSCILYGLPKCGKTTILSKLPNNLIIDTENGSDKISGLIKKVPQDKGPVAKMQWLDKFADELLKAGKPYDFVTIDTFTEVNEWAEWSGTFRYQNSILGSSFNRELDPNGRPVKGGTILKSSDPNYQSVHTLAEGYGYRWSREDTIKMFEKYMKVAKKCVFFVCHVEDKYVGGGDTRIKLKEEVAPKQISLTGKVKDILPRKVDAIGYIYNEDGEIKVNFTGSEERVGGNRCPHLQGYNDVLDWSKIFLK